MFDQIHSQLDLDKEILYWFFHQGPLKYFSLHILLASFQVEIAHNLLKVSDRALLAVGLGSLHTMGP